MVEVVNRGEGCDGERLFVVQIVGFRSWKSCWRLVGLGMDLCRGGFPLLLLFVTSVLYSKLDSIAKFGKNYILYLACMQWRSHLMTMGASPKF